MKLHPDRLRKHYSSDKSVRVFVTSMSDLFHPLIPDEHITRVFDVMIDAPQHTYQILKKRPERAATWPGPWPANVWTGTGVENQRATNERIPSLLKTPAAVRFLSCEPRLDEVNLRLDISNQIGPATVDGTTDGGFSLYTRPVTGLEEWRPAWI